jgi:hypothetical protein
MQFIWKCPESAIITQGMKRYFMLVKMPEDQKKKQVSNSSNIANLQ